MDKRKQFASQYALQLARILTALYKQEGIRGGKIGKVRLAARYITIPVRLANPVDWKKAKTLETPLAMAARARQALVLRAEDGCVLNQFELPETMWQTYSLVDLEASHSPDTVGVGFREGQRQVNLDFKAAPHVLLAGGSQVAGKSVLMLTILAGLATAHGPGSVKMLIVDPRHDLVALDDTEHLMLPIARTPGQAAQVIDRAWQEVFEVRGPADARNALPRLIVAIDEAQNIVPAAERQDRVAELGQEAGKYGVHLVVSSQKPLEDDLPRLLFNLGHRFCGQVPTPQEGSRLLGESGLGAERLTPQGDFIHKVGPVVQRLQVAMTKPEELAGLRRQVLVWPEVEEVAVMEEKKGGRPRIQPTGPLVGKYVKLLQEGDEIGPVKAKRMFGVTRTEHDINFAFALEIMNEVKL